ncbi:MAG: hypothetical protein KAQ85_00850 [Thermodesulfovibrionia bacterium]|nr:hypothetical protein [Thermodesulfovibrionia bacterium]
MVAKKVAKKKIKSKTTPKEEPKVSDQERLNQLEGLALKSLRIGALSLHWSKDVTKVVYTAQFYKDGTFNGKMDCEYGLLKNPPKKTKEK